MSHPFIVALLLIAPVVAPDDVPGFLAKRQPIDDKYPLPQDLEKAKKLRATRLAEMRKATVEVFNAKGNSKAPWAAAARKAMEAYSLRYDRRAIGLVGVDYQNFLDAVKAAVDAGCDDSLVRYWHTRFYVLAHPDRSWPEDGVPPDKKVEYFRDVLKRLPQTPYPASLRVHMAWNAYIHLQTAEKEERGILREGELAEAKKIFWKAFAELARAKDRLSLETTFEIAQLVMFESHRGEGREAGWKAVQKVFAEAKTAKWVQLVTEGYFLVQWAWDARGDGTADTVTEEGWKLFKERLTAAQDRLEKAWRAEPTFARTAAQLITVAMGLGWERDEMEKWFRRAMETDPDCFAACEAKREWLEPKWHGTEEDWEQFVYQCYRTKNWYSYIPLLLDHTLSIANARNLAGPECADYFAQPRVWVEIKALYTGYLREYPADQWARTRYAILCVVTRQLAEASKQFDALKDRPWSGLFPNRETFAEFRDKAKAAAPGKDK